MNKHQPRISIGLPVYNGENYIADAVESILSQSYSDLELLISDNDSNDHTEEICQDFCHKDPRIKYFRQHKNIGASPNFNHVFNLSKGKYFKWAAHDDVIAPDYISKCVEVLERDKNVVLCHTKVERIDPEGQTIEKLESTMDIVITPYPHTLFRDLLLKGRENFEIFGMIRANKLRSINPLGGYPGADLVMRAELGLLGKIVEIPEYLLYSRDHPDRSVRSLRSLHQRAEWFDPQTKGKTIFPYWRILKEYIGVIQRSPLETYEKYNCYLLLIRRLGRNFLWMRMILDLIIAIEPKTLELIYGKR